VAVRRSRDGHGGVVIPIDGTSNVLNHRPQGTGVMSIFGLPDEKITWGFLSSLDRLDADNSQIIISENDQTVFRVMLNSRIKYYNGNREFYAKFA